MLLAGLLARRLMGRWAAVLAAAFVAVIPFDIQVAHFYAVDTLLLFFVLLTLLACVMLAQGGPAEVPAPRPATDPDGEDDGEVRVPDPWRSWRAGLFVGAACGLALATKISALPLIAPMLVALALRWRRRGVYDALLAGAGMLAAALLVYMVTSPYTFIDWHNFQLQVNEQNQLSRGALDYPYVRQFAGTTPFLYQIQQLLVYDMGLPLGLLARRRLDDSCRLAAGLLRRHRQRLHEVQSLHAPCLRAAGALRRGVAGCTCQVGHSPDRWAGARGSGP